VEELADRVALIQNGQIQVTETPETLKASVGAQHFIELRKNGLAQDTIQRILQLPVVLLYLERDPDWISFGVSDPLVGAEAIIQFLRQEQITVGFRYHATSMEDAFLHHMGGLVEKFD
jgi:ABC-type multidrug transport system ATPase subunit